MKQPLAAGEPPLCRGLREREGEREKDRERQRERRTSGDPKQTTLHRQPTLLQPLQLLD